jgi:hypothetical protein
VAEAIKVTGLAEFNRTLKRLDAEVPKALRVALKRAFLKEGRYIVPALDAKRGQFEAALAGALLGAADSAGLEVS